MIAAFRPRPTPKEAGRIACDRNEEKKCTALAAPKPTEAFDGRLKAAERRVFPKELRASQSVVVLMLRTTEGVRWTMTKEEKAAKAERAKPTASNRGGKS